MEATSDGKRNRNYIVSEYLSKDGVDQTKIARVWQSPMDAGNTDPRDTSKTLAATPLAENSVSQMDISVNENQGKSAVTDYNAKAAGATSDDPASVQTTAPTRVTADITALKDILESGGPVMAATQAIISMKSATAKAPTLTLMKMGT